MSNGREIINCSNNSNTKTQNAVALDAGLIYNIPNSKMNQKLGLSFLNIGDTSFKEIGVLKSTTNIALSLYPKYFLLDIDYLDIFKHQKDSDFENSLKIKISRELYNSSLKLNTGLLYNSMLFGIDYQLSMVNLGLSTYKKTEYNGAKERIYQLSFALSW